MFRKEQEVIKYKWVELGDVRSTSVYVEEQDEFIVGKVWKDADVWICYAKRGDHLEFLSKIAAERCVEKLTQVW